VTPYNQLQGDEVVMSAWGVLQRCRGVDLTAIDAFVMAHADRDPATPGLDDVPRSPGQRVRRVN
jgi:hypothetical protein